MTKEYFLRIILRLAGYHFHVSVYIDFESKMEAYKIYIIYIICIVHMIYIIYMIYIIHMIFTIYYTFELKSQSLYLLKILTLTHFPPRLPECCHYWHRQVYYQQPSLVYQDHHQTANTWSDFRDFCFLRRIRVTFACGGFSSEYWISTPQHQF